jgi:hypothetical protein
MQAYMKSVMPYHGLSAPLLRKVCKAAFVDVQFASASQWQALVLEHLARRALPRRAICRRLPDRATNALELFRPHPQ